MVKKQSTRRSFTEAKGDGYSSYMITWEPWKPVPAKLGIVAQGAFQPSYSNVAIANGEQDTYITRFAQSVADSGIDTVYIRYAHEVNGTWYPWSRDGKAFVKAWQRIVTIFRSVGATNAKFVYSTNPNLYQDDVLWAERFWKYWPGDDYVDYVGSTMINFGSAPCMQIPCSGATKGYSVELFQQRITMANRLTGNSCHHRN